MIVGYRAVGSSRVGREWSSAALPRRRLQVLQNRPLPGRFRRVSRSLLRVREGVCPGRHPRFDNEIFDECRRRRTPGNFCPARRQFCRYHLHQGMAAHTDKAQVSSEVFLRDVVVCVIFVSSTAVGHQCTVLSEAAVPLNLGKILDCKLQTAISTESGQ